MPCSSPVLEDVGIIGYPRALNRDGFGGESTASITPTSPSAYINRQCGFASRDLTKVQVFLQSEETDSNQKFCVFIRCDSSQSRYVIAKSDCFRGSPPHQSKTVEVCVVIFKKHIALRLHLPFRPVGLSGCGVVHETKRLFWFARCCCIKSTKKPES